MSEPRMENQQEIQRNLKQQIRDLELLQTLDDSVKTMKDALKSAIIGDLTRNMDADDEIKKIWREIEHLKWFVKELTRCIKEVHEYCLNKENDCIFSLKDVDEKILVPEWVEEEEEEEEADEEESTSEASEADEW